MWSHADDQSMIAQAPRRTIAPSALPVAVTQLKTHARVDSADEEALLTAYIEAATAHLDGYGGILGVAIMRQTWAQSFSRFPLGRRVRLPIGPIATKGDMAVSYVDRDGLSQTLPPESWHLVTLADGPHVELAADAQWPATAERPDAITLTAACGHTSADTVPAPIKQAIRLIATLWIEQREAGVAVNLNEIPFGARSLIAPLRRIGF